MGDNAFDLAILEGQTMGIGIRVFFVDDNDSLQRLPLARLERLLRFDRGESLSQHAGKCIQCAMVFLKVEGRLVLSIRDIDYRDASWNGSPTSFR